MRIFAASLATETNSFSPIPTNRRSFEDTVYFRPGEHPDRATHCTAPLWVARRRARQEGFELVEGSCFWAEPSGPVLQADYEGDIVERVRTIVGRDTTIGVELDPHCHLTQKRVRNADIVILYKEYPHTDFIERAEELVTLVLKTRRAEIRPVMSLYDCGMEELFPTGRQPGRGFVDR